MSIFNKIPKHIRYINLQIAILFVYNLLHRVIFYLFFAQLEKSDSQEILKAVGLGIRFDLKLAILAIFPLAILIFIFNTKFFEKPSLKKINLWYLTLTYLIITLFYLFDYGNYEYLSLRLDVSFLRFFDDVKISTQVLLESYPIFKGLFALFSFLLLVSILINWLYNKQTKTNKTYSKKQKALFIVVQVLMMSYGVYSSISHYPLRWSEAFFSKENATNQFALNPVLYFFDSFAFHSDGFDMEKTKEYFPAMASYLNISKDSVNFNRKVTFKDSYKQKPNQVY